MEVAYSESETGEQLLKECAVSVCRANSGIHTTHKSLENALQRPTQNGCQRSLWTRTIVMEEKSFTPALGYSFLTPFYDFVISILTREKYWRSKVIEYLNPQPHDCVLDVGCGTGSLAAQIKEVSLLTNVIGLDPDPSVLQIARQKAASKNLDIEWCEGFLTGEFVRERVPVDKVVSSLVFHQTSLDEKLNILERMNAVLKPGGELCIADYGFQRTVAMSSLFRATVQQLDGVIDTQPNADGVLPDLMRRAGIVEVEEVEVIPTITGSISIYLGRKAM